VAETKAAVVAVSHAHFGGHWSILKDLRLACGRGGGMRRRGVSRRSSLGSAQPVVGAATVAKLLKRASAVVVRAQYAPEAVRRAARGESEACLSDTLGACSRDLGGKGSKNSWRGSGPRHSPGGLRYATEGAIERAQTFGRRGVGAAGVSIEQATSQARARALDSAPRPRVPRAIAPASRSPHAPAVT
jgi:hypothetical protein